MIPDSLGDPTDPLGTPRPNEIPANNRVEPPFRRLSIAQRASGPNVPEDLPRDTYALVSMFFIQEVLYIISMHINTYTIQQSSQWRDNWVELTPSELQTWLGIHVFMTISGAQTSWKARYTP